MIKSKFVQVITVIDPDSNLPVEVEIRKLETGGMVGIDGSWLANDEGPVYSPFDKGEEIEIPDEQYQIIHTPSGDPLVEDVFPSEEAAYERLTSIRDGGELDDDYSNYAVERLEE